MIKSINPTNGELIKEYGEMEFAGIEKILASSDKRFKEWKKLPFARRSGLIKNAAAVLRNKSEEYARIMTLEMGKPIVQSRQELEKCARVCDFYAENGEKFLQDEIIKTEASKSYITYNPLGTILAVMPWNFPFWQVFRFAAPNLTAGNTAVLKHSSNVTGCALAIEDIFKEAGFPEEVFRTIIAPSKIIEKVIKHPLIKAVTLTGSTAAGQSVAASAGSVLKKSVLELGGSDPYLILEDADLDYASTVCVNARLINSGQSCIAAKRFIILEEVYDKFFELFKSKMETKIIGDPLDEKTEVGPQARADLRDDLHLQVERSIKKGAVLNLGGNVPEGKGAFYPPTILSGIKPGMPAYEEEFFGPVALMLKAKDEKEAIHIANDTTFGLGSAVFTQDIARGERIAKDELIAGSAFVNKNVASDMNLPFGGVKESGYGRELSEIGIKEFMNIKTVSVK